MRAFPDIASRLHINFSTSPYFGAGFSASGLLWARTIAMALGSMTGFALARTKCVRAIYRCYDGDFLRAEFLASIAADEGV